MKNYSFRIKNWYKQNKKGNVHIPLLGFGFNNESFYVIILGFGISIWKKDK